MRRIFGVMVLVLLASLSFANVGIYYNSTSKEYVLNNSDNLQFFVDSLTGINFYNDGGQNWSVNEICVNSTLTGYVCSETIPISSWASSTDNFTYANLTGTKTYNLPAGRRVTVTVEYYITNIDRRLRTRLMESTNYATDGWVEWRVHNIQVGGTPINSSIRVNGENYLLNDTVNKTYVGNHSYYLWKSPEDIYWAQTDWDGDYNVSVIRQAGYNAMVLLRMPVSGTSAVMTFYWIDATCTWTCYKQFGSTQLFQGSTTTAYGWWGGVGSGCPASRALTLKFANYSTFYTMASSGNLSIGGLEFNPQLTGNDPDGDTPAYWTIKGNDVTNGTAYPVKVTCDTTDSSTAGINVSAVPPSQCSVVTISTTLTSSKYGVCYNVTGNNINFNCNGYSIVGNTTPVYHNAFNLLGVKNVTIRNCRMTNFSSAIFSNSTINSTFFNDSFYNSVINTTSSYDDVMMFEVYNSTNLSIRNSTLSNVSVNRYGTTGSGGYGYFFYGDNITMLDVKNVSIQNVTSSYYRDVDHQATSGVGFTFDTSASNIRLDNSSLNIIGTAYTHGGSTGSNVIISNVTLTNVSDVGILSASIPINIMDVRVITSDTANGISLGHLAYGSNITRYNYTGVYSATSGAALSFSDSTGDPRLQNVTVSEVVISNVYRGINLNQVVNNSFSNVLINHTRECVFVKGDANRFYNITCDTAYIGFETQLTDYFLGGSYDTIFANSTIYHQSNTSKDYYSAGVSYNIKFVNTTMNYSNITVASGDNFTKQWYVRVNVTDSVGSPLSATVNDTQNTATGNQTLYGYYSLTPYYLVNESYWLSGAQSISYNNHTIIANHSGASPTSNTTSVNITGRDWTINLTLYVPVVTSSCTYPGSGNWILKMEDKCNITSSQYLGTASLILNGTSGYVTFGVPAGSTLIVTAQRFFWNITGSVYIWFKNNTWFNGTMGG